MSNQIRPTVSVDDSAGSEFVDDQFEFRVTEVEVVAAVVPGPACQAEAVDIRNGCADIRAVSEIKAPRRHECDDCVRQGSKWVHLRTCQACGGTRCCDSSPNRHARRHAMTSRHAVISSAEIGERWLYCYRDEETIAY